MDIKAFTVDLVKKEKRIITPWKINVSLCENYQYADGWNDCIKELNKNYKKFYKEVIEKNL